MDLVQPESDLTEEDELELLELALAQSKMAVDNLEEVMLRWIVDSKLRSCPKPLIHNS